MKTNYIRNIYAKFIALISNLLFKFFQLFFIIDFPDKNIAILRTIILLFRTLNYNV